MTFGHVGRSKGVTHCVSVIRSRALPGQLCVPTPQILSDPKQANVPKKGANNWGRQSELQYIYISPNYFAAWVERSKTPCAALTFCGGSRAVWRFSAGKTNTIEEVRCKVSEVHCFTMQIGTPFRAGPDLPTLSRIHARRALWPANGAIRPKSRR